MAIWVLGRTIREPTLLIDATRALRAFRDNCSLPFARFARLPRDPISKLSVTGGPITGKPSNTPFWMASTHETGRN